MRRTRIADAALVGVLATVLTMDAYPSPVLAASSISYVAMALSQIGQRGADLPFVEYEAEAGVTNGKVIGPSRTFGTLASEASGRRAVRLDDQGEYVSFVLAAPANAVTVRYAIPDSANGTGLAATLSVLANGQRIGTLATTSRYGWFYGANPFSNTPADGKAHHFYDEARLRFGKTLPPGTVVKIAVAPGDTAPWYVIDVADFEQVPAAKPQPDGSLSIVSYGADPSGSTNSLRAIQSAIIAGQRQGKIVWIPTGTYRVDGHLVVDKVTVAGAGPWYSVLNGKGVGVYGNYAPNPSQHVVLQDFAIIGDVTNRDDTAPLSGVGGSLGGGSRLSNLWIQHQKTGVWLDGPFDGFQATDLRILDTTADGVNFRRGISHAIVRNSFIRNTGDDGLAMWSRLDADHDNVFQHNTVVEPILANGIALYGGHDNQVLDNVVADTLTEGGGIHVGNRFTAVPLSGTTTVSGNLIVRGGGSAPGWTTGIGAFWVYAVDAPIAATIRVINNGILDSSGSAIQIKGKSITGLTFENLAVNTTGSHLVDIQAPGSASFHTVLTRQLGGAAVSGCRPDFRLNNLGGNFGWTPGC